MTIKARPTVYKGIHMRSRLEARFAAELDVEGHRWIYEPRAYAGYAGQYLPDFELVDWGPPTFIEVKPTLLLGFPFMERMEVIRESEPTAVLIIVTADGWQMTGYPVGALFAKPTWELTRLERGDWGIVE